MTDLLTELDDACALARTGRELERLCGNAAKEIRELREEVKRVEAATRAACAKALCRDCAKERRPEWHKADECYYHWWAGHGSRCRASEIHEMGRE